MKYYTRKLALGGRIQWEIRGHIFSGVELPRNGAEYTIWDCKLIIKNKKISIFKQGELINDMFEEEIKLFEQKPDNKIILNIIFKKVLEISEKNK